MGTDGNIKFMQKIKPSIILGVPSYVYHVLCVAKEQGVRLDFIKKVVLGAARVTVAFKQKLAETLEGMGATNVSIFGTYGFTESRCAWAESPTKLDVSSGYYLYPDKEVFEVVDPNTGEVKGEGEDGEIVYTSIDARGSCVIRYRTGDFVKGGIIYSPCPYTKKTVPRLSSDITRLSDIKDLQLSKVKGSLVNFSSFDAVLSEIDLIDEWQIEIRKRNNDPFDMDELVVYVSPKANCDEVQLAEEIKKQMQVTTEVTPNEVKFISNDEIVKRLELETANKDKRIIDRRPK
jgi:phenylacetate-coenzyme A ligase PaaK-like adenylate-forming protein